jgi:8-oxo-dGTP pyrophosphatase MutT (NUDIX family)
MTTNNDNTKINPVGRFMVAVGAIMSNEKGEILLIKRSPSLDWHPGEWETMYGRLAQFEDAESGLKRELHEELGIDVEIGKLLSVWHIFRGAEQTAYNELIGITYNAKYHSGTITLSDEHSEFRWVSPQVALGLITIPGIFRDIKKYLEL